MLTPLISAIDLHRTLLNTPFPSEDSNTTTTTLPSSSSSITRTQYHDKINAASASIKASEAALGSLAASARLLRSDLIYGRFSPLDFAAFQQMCRRMSGRTNGLATFFSFVGLGAGAGIGLGAGKSGGDETPAHTVPNSPEKGTPRAGPSRKTSMHEDDEGKSPHAPSSPHTTLSHTKAPSSILHQRHLHHDHDHSHKLHTSLLSLSRHGPSYDKPNRGHETTEHAVGIFESQRYLNLEATLLWDPNWEEWTRKALQGLGERWVATFFFLFVLLLMFFIQLRPRPWGLQRWTHRRQNLVRRCSLWQIHIFAWNPMQRERRAESWNGERNERTER